MDKKYIGTIIIAIIATALITYFLIPSKTITVPHTVIVADTGTVARTEYQKALKQYEDTKAEVTGLRKLLQLAQIQQPTGGGVTNPVKPPIEGIKPSLPAPSDSGTFQDRLPEIFPFDFPIGMTLTKNKVSFLTMNPYLKYMELPYVKTYEFERTTSNFSFALTRTDNSAILNGIVFKSEERFFSFDGITAGGGVMFPKSAYAILEMKFSMYERLHIDPRITSRPEAGIELKYDIIK
jgi:hypothetical protein